MSNRGRRVKRLAGSFAVLTMLATFVPLVALATSASAAAPAPQDTTAFCAGGPTGNPFPDITDPTDPHYANIACAKDAGVVNGKTDGLYHETEGTSRAQMGSILARETDKMVSLAAPGKTLNPLPAAAATNPFVDVGDPPSSGSTPTAPHTDNILRIFAAGITQGTDATHYSPAGLVTRFQMAKFEVAKLEFVTGTTLDSSCGATFPDGAETDPTFGTFVLKAACAGIVQGKDDGSFHGSDVVTRGQEATFAIRGMAWAMAGGFITALHPTVTPNQDFPIDPQLPSVNVASSSASDNTGLHHYDVTIPDPTADPTVDLTVIPASAVNLDVSQFPNIAVSFEDDNHDGKADFVDDTIPALNTTAVIEAINNVNPVGGATPYVNNQSTTGGKLGVDIDSQFPADGVFLLVFADKNGDNRLSVDSNNKATEPFGLSGFKGWTNCESQFESNFNADNVIIGGGALAQVIDFFSATSGDPQVTDPNCAALVNNFGGLGTRYNYDDNDIFRIGGVQVSKAIFEAELSRGDDVDVDYNPDPAGISEFNIFSNPGFDAPNDLTANAANLDAGATGNDVVLDFTTPSFNQPGAQYVIQRRSTAGPDGICGTADDTDGQLTGFTDVTTLTLDTFHGQDPGDALEFADMNVPDGCYDYRVSVTDPNIPTNVQFSNTEHVLVPAPPDTTKPNVIQSVMKDNNNPNQLDSGDVIDIIWDEQVAAAAGDTIQIADQDGEFANLVLGTGNTFTLTTRGGTAEAGQTELHIVLTATPTVAGDEDGNTANNDGVLDFTFFPNFLFLDGATGITDVAGNTWEPTGELVTVDTDGPTIANDSSIVGDTSFSVFFNEPVDPTSAGDPTNYKVDNDGTFGDGVGTNPVLGVTVSNSSNITNAPFNDAWTKVTIHTQLGITNATAVSQTVKDKVGNPGQDTQAAPFHLTAGGVIVLNPTTATTTEGGGCDTLQVSLASQPTQSVFIGLGSSDTTEGTVPAGPLTFTPANWNVPQSVQVCGVDDTIDDGNQPYLIVAQATSSEPEFNGATQSVGYTNLDNDQAGIIVTGEPVDVFENAGSGPTTNTFGVSLAADPGGTVNIQVTSASPADYTVSPTVLTFTSANFATPQNVTVSAIDDTTCEANPEVFSTQLAVLPGAPAAYTGLTDTAQTRVFGPEDVCGQPSITSADQDPGTNTVLAHMDEAVDCRAGNPATADNFSWASTLVNSQAGPFTGTNIQQENATTCRITFGAAANWSSEDAGTLTYTEDTGASCGPYPPASGCPTDVTDLDGIGAAQESNQSIDTSLTGNPIIDFSTSGAASDSVFFQFTEPIRCGTFDFTDVEVRVNGSLVPVTSVGSDCQGVADNDVSVTVGHDILVGDSVNIRILPNTVLDWTNNGNLDSNDTSTAI